MGRLSYRTFPNGFHMVYSEQLFTNSREVVYSRAAGILIQDITMKTCRIPYKIACHTGVHNLSNEAPLWERRTRLGWLLTRLRRHGALDPHSASHIACINATFTKCIFSQLDMLLVHFHYCCIHAFLRLTAFSNSASHWQLRVNKAQNLPCNPFAKLSKCLYWIYLL